MLTIPIILTKIIFLTNFRFFFIFAKNGKNKKIAGLNANILEI